MSELLNAGRNIAETTREIAQNLKGGLLEITDSIVLGSGLHDLLGYFSFPTVDDPRGDGNLGDTNFKELWDTAMSLAPNNTSGGIPEWSPIGFVTSLGVVSLVLGLTFRAMRKDPPHH